MADPNAEPPPAELAAWREVDVAQAKIWAAQRLERARRLGDDQARQHLGNLIAEIERAAQEIDSVTARHARCDAAARALLADLDEREQGDPVCDPELADALRAALESR